jgi:calcineurin-like phosphoesterase family protein
MRWFTADLHLQHRKIIEHCHRPFATVEEMDATLIANINARVTRGDLLYILGDFSMGNFETVKDQRSQITCANVHFIMGNHDRLSGVQYEKAGFVFHGDMYEIKEGEQNITLCHYAMRRWNKSHRGSWCLYGHSHGHLPDDPTLFSFDVGVDCHDFFPLSFTEVEWRMCGRTEAFAAQNHPTKEPE